MELPWADTHPLFLVFQVRKLKENLNKLIQVIRTLFNVAVDSVTTYISVEYNGAKCIFTN